ncbi:hypothetical protein GF373_17330 [bacterium]|nr:hypothetical protein [bacterium]
MNDCRVWHAGSAYTSDRILEGLRSNGYDDVKVWPNFGRMPTDSDVDRDRKWLGSGVVVLNGEGTLHDDQSSSRAWLRYCDGMVDGGCSVYLVNSLWQRMGREAVRILGRFNGLYFRDPWSLGASKLLGEWRADATVTDELYRDSAGWFIGDTRLLDSPRVLPGLVCARGNVYTPGPFRDRLGDSHLRMESLPLRGYRGTFRGYVDHLHHHVYCLYTGEYHGVIAAILAGINWVAIPAPTWKIEALDHLCAEEVGVEPQEPPIIGRPYHREAFRRLRKLNMCEVLGR